MMAFWRCFGGGWNGLRRCGGRKLEGVVWRSLVGVGAP